VKSCLLAYLVILLTALGNFVPMYAHNGPGVSAPTNVPGTITLDGTITFPAENVWGAGVPIDTLPNDCAEFDGMSPAPPVTFYALNDGVNLYLAFDIPDTSANPNDALFLAFDPNHSADAAPAAGDRAFLFTFADNTANNITPGVTTWSGPGWGTTGATLPADVLAKYRRITTGGGKWQIEMRFPFASTVGFSFLYINKAPGNDCDEDGIDDDFYANYPTTLTFPPTVNLPSTYPPPSSWGDLSFGPQPPTVGFAGSTCCYSPAITFSPSTQPFAPGVPVNINATVHNFHATSTANNVNVEIRVHKFGTGAGVVAPFPLSNQVASIAPGGDGSGTPVTWPTPPAGLHGCIRAEIKPPTVSQYFIAGGAGQVQHNIDVAEMESGAKEALNFMTFNPDPQKAVKIRLAKRVLLPDGFKGLTFELKQPDRELRAQEEFPVQLIVTAAADTPLTRLPTQKVQVPPTAGGAGLSPGADGALPARERSGTEAVSIPVKPGDRLHLKASGEVDLDGGGAIPASGPDGQDVSKSIGQRSFLLRGEFGSQYGGALLGSFDNFASSFVVGSEGTVTVPNEVKDLKLAVNDLYGGFADNSGKGFEVVASTLPAFTEASPAGAAAKPETAAAKITLPQVNITATSTTRLTVGQASYNLLTNHGGVTYQFLVVAGGHSDGGYLFGLSKTACYALLLLLIILLILILIWIRARKKPAI
jgi:hypothetical protein